MICTYALYSAIVHTHLALHTQMVYCCTLVTHSPELIHLLEGCKVQDRFMPKSRKHVALNSISPQVIPEQLDTGWCVRMSKGLTDPLRTREEV